MVHDDETNWLNRVYGRSVEQLHSRNHFGGFNQPNRNETIATFSTMREIAHRRNPGSVSKINTLERLCLDAIDGRISTKEFFHGCKRVAHQAKVSNHITDFLDDLKINQSDIRPQKSQEVSGADYWSTKNPAWSMPAAIKQPRNKETFYSLPNNAFSVVNRSFNSPKKSHVKKVNVSSLGVANSAWNSPSVFSNTRRVSKSKKSFDPINHAFDRVNDALGGVNVRAGKTSHSAFDVPDVFNNNKTINAFANHKKSSPRVSQPKGSRSVRSNPWARALQNPAFTNQSTRDVNKKMKSRLNNIGILEWK